MGDIIERVTVIYTWLDWSPRNSIYKRCVRIAHRVVLEINDTYFDSHSKQWESELYDQKVDVLARTALSCCQACLPANKPLNKLGRILEDTSPEIVLGSLYTSVEDTIWQAVPLLSQVWPQSQLAVQAFLCYFHHKTYSILSINFRHL